jgi:glutamine amidotransferase
VHSYHFRTVDAAHAPASTPYCGGFSSIVCAGNVMGTQFHPEKSSRPGFQIIRNFLSR